MRLDDITGVRLRSVAYLTLPELAEERYVRYPVGHDVSMGIELGTEGGGRLTISWLTEGTDARVDVSWGGIEERFPSGSLTRLDATAWPEWADLLGRGVEHVQSVEGLKPLEAGRTQAGVRLGFTDGRSVTVALGEVTEEGRLEYSPDNLVVLFDRTIAQAYEHSLAEEPDA
ncbi:MAG: hypothetical protein GEV07_15040 [Streptosporangiales bacterium]|nr:hypothetical protein [Streptosporangiales bacterium]